MIATAHPSFGTTSAIRPRAGYQRFSPKIKTAIPTALFNDRFTSEWADFTTPEYASYDKITPRKWEANRGIGHSFRYNRAKGSSQMLSVHELVRSLVDIVSKNGNLLLDIGPEADGTVSRLQLERLTGLGNWLAKNGEAIFDTDPFLAPLNGLRAEGVTQGGTPIRFTQKKGFVYASYSKSLSVPE